MNKKVVNIISILYIMLLLFLMVYLTFIGKGVIALIAFILSMLFYITIQDIYVLKLKNVVDKKIKK